MRWFPSKSQKSTVVLRKGPSFMKYTENYLKVYRLFAFLCQSQAKDIIGSVFRDGPILFSLPVLVVLSAGAEKNQNQI